MSQLATQWISEDQVHDSSCPICSASSVRIVETFEGRSLIKCRECRVAYLYPQPSASEFTNHFEVDDASANKERERRFESNREPVLDRIVDYIRSRKQPGDILDVGCATGYFLARFCRGTNWRPWGVELSHNFAEQAAAKGIQVRLGQIVQAGFSDCSFDVITVLDAFYYFPEPRATLVELRRILKPEGMLLLDLPLGGSRIWRTNTRLGRTLSATRAPLLQTSDHLFYYAPHTIQLLLKQCGFEIQALRLLPANRQARPLRNAIYRSFYYCSCALSAVSASRVFLGPRFLVAAVKRSS